MAKKDVEYPEDPARKVQYCQYATVRSRTQLRPERGPGLPGRGTPGASGFGNFATKLGLGFSKTQLTGSTSRLT